MDHLVLEEKVFSHFFIDMLSSRYARPQMSWLLLGFGHQQWKSETGLGQGWLSSLTLMLSEKNSEVHPVLLRKRPQQWPVFEERRECYPCARSYTRDFV